MKDIPIGTRPNWVEIESSAIDNNFRLVRAMLPDHVRIHASVKNRAYGLGLTELAARFLGLGAEALSAGSFRDAVKLRQAGFEEAEIVMFGGTLPSGIPHYLQHNLIPTVHNHAIAEAVSQSARKLSKVYVKVDCGWGRLGFPVKTAHRAVMEVARLPNVELAGLYTHLPFSTQEGFEDAQARTNRFRDLVDALRKEGLEIPITQARASAGVLMGLEDGCNSVAPGAALYGKRPLPPQMHDFAGFKPVLKAVKTRLIHVRHAANDPTSGMNSRFSSQVKSATGVIPFGRSDGNRLAQPDRQAHVLIRGVRAPVLSVSSELAVLDISDIKDAQVGDEVILIGRSGDEEISLADLAHWQGTAEGDILMMLSDRMPVLDKAERASASNRP